MNTATNLHDSLFGNIPYVASEIFKTNKTKLEQDPYTKYSDIYSLGVLLWQISSGKTPFEGQDKNMLCVTIMSGIKEERMPDTPDDYYNLYNQCWNDEPETRPAIKYIYDTLKELLKENIEINNDNYNLMINDNNEGQ